MGFIRSKLENDLYKFSMSYFYMMKYPKAEGIFVFHDRNNSVYSEKFVQRLKDELESFTRLELTADEFDWAVKNIPYIPRFFWEWYRGFKFDPSAVSISLDEENHLKISASGYLYQVTFWEVPILAMVSELKNEMEGNTKTIDTAKFSDALKRKIKLSNDNGLKFSIFGLRRRFSGGIEDIVTDICKRESNHCVGTSNVYLAFKYHMRPTGTLAHELIMAAGSWYGYRMANWRVMEDWSSVFGIDLGTMLIDTFTCNTFFWNFTREHAHLFSSLRIDSGDEYEIADRAIEAYQKLGINPTQKTLIFSNSLDFPKALAIQQYCGARIKASFGIGGNLTADVPGVKPSNIVMKLSRCKMNDRMDWRDCIKISDDLGKHMGKEGELKKALIELEIEKP